MKALSLLQPWASLVIFGEKEIETRSWRPSNKEIDTTIAIHASKAFNAEERQMALMSPFREALKAHGFKTLGDVPRGVILGTVRIVTFERSESVITQLATKELAFGNYEEGRWGWRFADVRRIEPIACRGALSLWPVSEELLAQFRYLDQAA